MTPLDKIKATKLVSRGLPLATIASKLGFSEPTIRSYLRSTGWKPTKLFNKERAISEHPNYAAGKTTVRELAKKYGCTTNAILLAFKRAQLDTLSISEAKQKAAKLARLQAGIHDITFMGYSTYKEIVRAITKRNLLKYGTMIDPTRKRGTRFHIDHRVSIYDGYYTFGLSPQLIAHPANLVLLSAKDNTVKGRKSSIRASALKTAIRRWENTNEQVD